MYNGRKVNVLRVENVDSPAVSSLRETRYIHNIEGLKNYNYEPGPQKSDINRIISEAEKLKAHNGIDVNFHLTRDGYLYYSQMTPGYCDGEIKLTKDQLLSAVEDETTIY